MRTTVRIDDDLLEELKEFAHRRGVSVAQLVNQSVRAGLKVVKKGGAAPKKAYREKSFAMGAPKVDLTKALQLAYAMEDEAVVEKLRFGK